MRTRKLLVGAIAIISCSLIFLPETRELVAGEIRVDCSKRVGHVRPLPDVVDMHAVFPDPAADPRDPESYDFKLTDTYLQAICDTGAGMVYRLGESIEHTRHKRYVHPPADPQRWAEACLGIIRHYNEGWADGFRHDIRYWEIWNEPENRPVMWTGTDEQYYRLYATAAKAIKAAYPDLQVGGPAVGAPGEVEDGRLQATPFVEGFLRHCRTQQAPLDFFSWHIYTDDPQLVVHKAHAIRRWLDEGRNCVTILIANYRSDDTQFDLIVDALPWKSPTVWKTWRVDDASDLKQSETGKSSPGDWRQAYRIPAPGLLVIQLRGER